MTTETNDASKNLPTFAEQMDDLNLSFSLLKDFFDAVYAKIAALALLSFSYISPYFDDSSTIAIVAKQMDKDKFIYAWFGILDGLNLAYSSLKYIFDLAYTESTNILSTDAMHDWCLTPEGLIVIFVEAIALMTFSFISNYYKEFEDSSKECEKNSAFTQFIVDCWPYVRIILKGFKNTYKGIKGTIKVSELIHSLFTHSTSFNYLILPTSLALTGVLLIIRLPLYDMIVKRKKMMENYKDLLTKLKNNINNLTEAEYQNLIKQLEEYQKDSEYLTSQWALAGCSVTGLIDGLYLYFGVFALCSVTSPAALWFLLICAVIFTVACMVKQTYEEYEYQQKLRIADKKAALALVSAAIMINLKEQKQNGERLKELINDYNQLQLELAELTSLSKTAAFLLGLKRGLYFYSAVSSLVIFLGVLLFLSGGVFPPWLLLSCVSIGIVSLISCIGYSVLFSDYTSEVKHLENDENLQAKLEEADTHAYALNLEIGEVMQSCWETCRSLFAGGGKGVKAVEFLLNFLQEQDDNGHYHDTSLMFWIMLPVIIVHAIVFAFRALAKGAKKLFPTEEEKPIKQGIQVQQAQAANKDEFLKPKSLVEAPAAPAADEQSINETKLKVSHLSLLSSSSKGSEKSDPPLSVTTPDSPHDRLFPVNP